ncbi:hypothetical protein ACQJBY_015750 [Aegilops geniculata]
MLVVVGHIPTACGSRCFQSEAGLLAIHHQPVCRKTKAMKRIHERSSRREVEKMWRFCLRRWASNIRQWTTGSCRGWWLQFPREWSGVAHVGATTASGSAPLRPQQQRTGIDEKIEGVADIDTQFQQD